VHFLLDVDGTIYQTLDLHEKAFHATYANDFSIGVEIAHPGAWKQPMNATWRAGTARTTRAGS
jgi:N-acetyl-anhydromuramyl-L-alanine amidase AmpD